MATKWYLVPKSSILKEAEIGSYKQEGSLTDFPRGTFLAYQYKGLVTGLKSKEEAELWRDKGKYNEKTDTWTDIPR